MTTNENIPQAFLHKSGVKSMAHDIRKTDPTITRRTARSVAREIATSEADPVDVRNRGVSRLGRKVAQAALAGSILAGGVVLLDSAIDHSPTTVYQNHLQNNEGAVPGVVTPAGGNETATTAPIDVVTVGTHTPQNK